MATYLQLEPFCPRSSGHSEVVLQSTTSSMQVGEMLSAEAEVEFIGNMKSIVQASFGELVQSGERLHTVLEEFSKETSEANKMFAEYTLQIGKDLREGIIVEPVRVKNAKFLKASAVQIADRYKETVEQTIQLNDLSRESRLGDYEGAITLLYKARMEQLKLVRSKMRLLHSQENHDLQVLIGIHNQRLKEEAQKLDQVLKMANFRAKEKEREFRRALDLSNTQKKEKE